METLLVGLGDGKVYREDFRPEVGRFLGGRQFIAHWLVHEVDPGCDPLGPDNDLILAPGLLAGTSLSSSNRLSVGAKSPLTGGAKEANAGGVFGLRLASSGIGALVLRGHAGQLSTLVIEGTRATLEPCPELAGLGVYDCARVLDKAYGAGAALGIVGPAGERGLPVAAIAFTDKDGNPGRFAGRGGLGAVMGRKGVKAIVVRKSKASPPTGEWTRLSKEVARVALANSVISGFFPVYGTAGTLEMTNAAGGLPVRNFREGRFELAERIGGEALRATILARGGLMGHTCMPGCVVRCSNRYVDKDGADLVSPLEYETIALLGSNLGLGDLDAIALLNRFANDFGADTIELGATLGVALDAGLGDFGDLERTRHLTTEMAEGTPLGLLLGQGAAVAGRALGARRIPTVKGQAMPGYDPRAFKGNGVLYATCPMGADHTAGNTIGARVDHDDMSGKVELSRGTQLRCAAFDALGLCEFMACAYADNPEPFLGLAGLRLGEVIGADGLLAEGERTIRLELAFNEACGLGPSADRLPDFVYREPLPPNDYRWDGPPNGLAGFWRDT